MKKWKVYGRIRADIEFSEDVEAKSEAAAIKIAEKRVHAKTGITDYDVLDHEIYADIVHENTR